MLNGKIVEVLNKQTKNEIYSAYLHIYDYIKPRYNRTPYRWTNVFFSSIGREVESFEGTYNEIVYMHHEVAPPIKRRYATFTVYGRVQKK